MNKKLLLIPVVIGIVILIAIKALQKGPVHGDKAEMEVPSATVPVLDMPKAVTVILDNSGSMQGYVNFSGKGDEFTDARQTMITNVADFMGNVDSRCKLVSTAFCGSKSYTSGELIRAMRNYSAFSGAVTEVDGLVKKAIETAADSGVSVIVSDMMLSYGKAAVLQYGKDYNRHELPALSSLIGNQFKPLEKEGIGVLILKYESDFNGTYYYNCTENTVPSEFRNTLMKKRPYYFFVIGKEKYIKALCVKNCFPQPSEVFSTIEIDDADMTVQAFAIEKTQSSHAWNIGEAYDRSGADETICIWTKDNFGDAMPQFRFVFDEIKIPLYARGALQADFDRSVVGNVSFDAGALSYLMVTLNPFKTLPKEDDEVEIKLEVLRNANVAASSVDVDYGVEASRLEGKTWGFSSIIEKIYQAYDIKDGDKETVAKLKFAFSKK